MSNPHKTRTWPLASYQPPAPKPAREAKVADPPARGRSVQRMIRSLLKL